MTNLSEYIARQIFKTGDEKNYKASRIEFRSGDDISSEVGLGGLCEEALAVTIERAIEEYTRWKNQALSKTRKKGIKR